MTKLYLVVLALLCPALLFGQAQPPSAYQPQLITYGGTPYGPCQTYQFAQNVSTGSYYNCVGGAWQLVAGANNPAPQYGAAYYLGPGTTNIIAGSNAGLTGQAFASTNGSPPSFQSPGIVASVNSPVSTTPYTIACDSATAIVDRAHSIHFNSGSGTITVPLSTATGCNGGFSTILYDDTGNLTVNATSADTFNIYTGNLLLTGQTTFTLYKGQVATLDQDATGIWSIRVTGPTAAPTIASGFNTSGFSISANNGTATFNVTVGTGTGTSTGVLTMPAAPTAWNCFATNRNRADHIQQTAQGSTSVTLTNYSTTFSATNWTNSDVIQVSCLAY